MEYKNLPINLEAYIRLYPKYAFQDIYQQYTKRWDNIGLFIDNNYNHFDDYSKMKYGCGIHCSDMLYGVVNGEKSVF